MAEKGAAPATIDQLLSQRFHGAANISGVRYQLLYAVNRALEMMKSGDPHLAISLERLEDVDAHDFRTRADNLYCQCKNWKDPLTWSRLPAVLLGFWEILRVEPEAMFRLVLSRSPDGLVKTLRDFRKLPAREQQKFRVRFHDLSCEKLGISTAEADRLLNTIEIEVLTEDALLKQLHLDFLNVLNLGSDAVDLFLAIFVGRFLDWANLRKTITLAELTGFVADVHERLGREEQFRAYAQGIVDRINWTADATPSDFLDGKQTRPGHITAGLDYRRGTWLDRIHQVLLASRACVVRSASGQGKSALMYRFAREHWNAEHIFTLNRAQSDQDVIHVRDYLKIRAELGVPLLLLIDNLSARCRLWPEVAQHCAALGIKVIVTVRHEDWFRFTRYGLSGYEVVEPVLDLREAKEIFSGLKIQGRVSPNIPAAEWAFEKLAEPKLLMEFIYLLTHGRMLEERLRDQLAEFSRREEDPAKFQILRRISVAQSMGCSADMAALCADCRFRDDPQSTIKALEHEYITVAGSDLRGLHWVRSNHLMRLLHESWINPAKTAIDILPAIAFDDLSTFVANALSSAELKTDLFFEGLLVWSRRQSLRIQLQVLDGVFAAGERQFFEANRNLFARAYEILGDAGTFLISIELSPLGSLDLLTKLTSDFGEAPLAKELLALSKQAQRVRRGIDGTRDFLSDLVSVATPNILLQHLDRAGPLLDWCAFTKVTLPSWPMFRDAWLRDDGVFNLSVHDFCALAQGVHRYDEAAYHSWFEAKRDSILAFLQLHLLALELRVEAGECFILVPGIVLDQGDSDVSATKQVVGKLELLRSALPFCTRYNSEIAWDLPFELAFSHETGEKHIPRESLPLRSDVDKNVVWGRIVETVFGIDSFWAYEKAWRDLRREALALIKALAEFLRRLIEGKPADADRWVKSYDLVSLLLRYTPALPPQTPEILAKKGKHPKWHSDFSAFQTMFSKYVSDRHDQHAGRLSVFNFHSTSHSLRSLHQWFDTLSTIAPDYFQLSELNAPELEAYSELDRLLEFWIEHRDESPTPNIRQFLRIQAEETRQQILHRLKRALEPLEREGMSFLLPRDVVQLEVLKYLPLAFSVSDPNNPAPELLAVWNALGNVRDVAHFFCLVPLFENARYLEADGWRLSCDMLDPKSQQEIVWESLVPQMFEPEVIANLAPLPKRPLLRSLEEQGRIWIEASLKALERTQKRFAFLRDADHPFRRQLHSHFQTKVRLQQRLIQDLADQLQLRDQLSL